MPRRTIAPLFGEARKSVTIARTSARRLTVAGSSAAIRRSSSRRAFDSASISAS